MVQRMRPQQRQKDEGNWTKRKATTTLQRSTFGPTDWQIECDMTIRLQYRGECPVIDVVWGDNHRIVGLSLGYSHLERDGNPNTVRSQLNRSKLNVLGLSENFN